VNGHEVVVGPGEVMELPGGVAHEVQVLEDAIVIDVFSPIRQDWIDGTDDYFRR
jgi:quercetin dioxygenase-like cupin family protein